jgi:nifR3 family TIM-barrel protein
MGLDQKLGRGAFFVGTVRLTGRALLAPMSGVTDVGFRRLAHRFGATLVVSEMVASRELVHGSAEAVMRAEGAGITPHVVQIAGCEAYWMGEAARVAEAAGAAIVDINMGCPAKRVTGGWAGSALMRDLDHAIRLVEAVVAAVTIPVTLKMRLGWDRDSLNAPELARRAAACGVALITVHGRTRQQFYKGDADWPAIARVCAASGAPVVANGDTGDLGAARRCLALSGADAVMIGRAALGRPWLVGQVARGLADGEPGPDPAVAEKTAAILEHYDTMLSLYGRAIGVRHARKHLAAYAEDAARAGSPLPHVLRARLVTSQDPHDVRRIIGQLYDFATPNLEAA